VDKAFCPPYTFEEIMEILGFYDVDKEYVKYLKKVETDKRGFTCMPDVEYQGEQKFFCGVVLLVNGLKYYVPVSSYKVKQSENILIVVESDKYNKVKGSLRFNYMFPVPDDCISERIIKDEINLSRRIFLNAQLKFCIDNAEQIHNQAKRTHTIITKKLNPGLLKNSCDFELLEEACYKYGNYSLDI
jgi:protein AbiQ